jgi:hypothetical protein
LSFEAKDKIKTTDAWLVLIMRAVTPCSPSLESSIFPLIFALAVVISSDSDALKFPVIAAFEVIMNALVADNDYLNNNQFTITPV